MTTIRLLQSAASVSLSRPLRSSSCQASVSVVWVGLSRVVGDVDLHRRRR